MSENIAESAERNDGGPIFPIKEYPAPWGFALHPGMSLRDWFAGQALLSLLNEGALDRLGATKISALAYMVADHMLAERSK